MIFTPRKFIVDHDAHWIRTDAKGDEQVVNRYTTWDGTATARASSPEAAERLINVHLHAA